MYDPADDYAVTAAYEAKHSPDDDEIEIIPCLCGLPSVTTRKGYWSERRIPVCHECDKHWADICKRAAFFDSKCEKKSA